MITRLTKCDRLGLGFGRFVPDPFLPALLFHLNPFAAPSPPLAAPPRRLSRRPRPAPLLPQCLLEPLDIDAMSVLRGDHLREIEREAIGVVELECILTGNHGLVP